MHPSTKELLNLILSSNDPDVIAEFAKNPTLTPQLFEQILQQYFNYSTTNIGFSRLVAMFVDNNDKNDKLIKLIAKHSNMQLKREVAKVTKSPILLAKLVEYNVADIELWKAVARNSKTPVDLAARLMDKIDMVGDKSSSRSRGSFG